MWIEGRVIRGRAYRRFKFLFFLFWIKAAILVIYWYISRLWLLRRIVIKRCTKRWERHRPSLDSWNEQKEKQEYVVKFAVFRSVCSCAIALVVFTYYWNVYHCWWQTYSAPRGRRRRRNAKGGNDPYHREFPFQLQSVDNAPRFFISLSAAAAACQCWHERCDRTWIASLFFVGRLKRNGRRSPPSVGRFRVGEEERRGTVETSQPLRNWESQQIIERQSSLCYILFCCFAFVALLFFPGFYFIYRFFYFSLFSFVFLSYRIWRWRPLYCWIVATDPRRQLTFPIFVWWRCRADNVALFFFFFFCYLPRYLFALVYSFFLFCFSRV